MIEFTVDLPPRPWQRAHSVIRYRGSGRFKKPYSVVIPDETTEADKAAFLWIAKPHAPRKPLAGPLLLHLVFIMPIPSSWSIVEQARAASGARWPTGKPDTDNMVKLVKDALNEIFWKDDAQVCVVHARKVYGMLPRTEVRITEITGPVDTPRLF